jgi:hypothetical protein
MRLKPLASHGSRLSPGYAEMGQISPTPVAPMEGFVYLRAPFRPPIIVFDMIGVVFGLFAIPGFRNGGGRN